MPVKKEGFHTDSNRIEPSMTGVILILVGFTLQSAQYWAVLLNVNVR
ncbi:MAG TPA: hypothetical protein VMT15_20490 [Bryobacteraceae bacterium]|nr:hypothetical protein [Bryobacteraceae bacterium]